MSAKKKTLIGETLIEKGIIDSDLLIKALEVQGKESPDKRRKIGSILIDEFKIDRELVYKEIAQMYGFKEFKLDGYKIEDPQIKFICSLIEKIPSKDKDFIVNNKVLPFKVSDNKSDVLLVIAADPTDKYISDLIIHFGFNKYEVMYAPYKEIDVLISKIPPLKNEFLQILDEMTSEIVVEADAEEVIDEAALDAEINQSKLTNLVEASLIEAVHQKASDIHVIPAAGNKVEIHFRVDGRLKVWHVQEKTRPEAISAVFKDRTLNVDRFERESAQDGFIQRKIDDYTIRYRVSILPIVGAEFERKLESIVIRVLDDRKVITDLGKLGLQKQAREDFVKAVTKPQGIVILTGPTGSGKSTTLIAALHYVIDPSLCILTVEDPVEYLIHGARQLKISDRMDFDQSLRAILRHDPDIVMLGEMRDTKTAETAIKLANTGHLTFSTLHTNDAPSAISRLYKMDIEPFLIASAINIVVAQRLIRTICSNCKKEIKDMNENIPKALGFSDDEIQNTTFYETVGCDECNKGYKGRAAIHEALLFTKEIKRIIFEARENINIDAIRDAAVSQGMLTLRRSGIERIKQGITTCEEVGAVTTDD
ncbi:MAG: type II/IV secretion system protein [bacterium]|nr:type II/IV secretion system protein [bacterium]